MTESDDGWATVETVVDDGVDNNIDGVSGQGPSGIDENGVLEKILFILSSINPWLLLFIAVGVYYLIQKFWFSSQGSSSTTFETLSSDEIIARQEAIEVARRRMQEQYDQKAQEHAAKQKEKEELMRQEKLKNLEKYGTKLGRSSKTLAAESNSDQLAQSAIKKKTEKPKLRPEYNPLMGDGSSGVCFRPSRRGGAGGG